MLCALPILSAPAFLHQPLVRSPAAHFPSLSLSIASPPETGDATPPSADQWLVSALAAARPVEESPLAQIRGDAAAVVERLDRPRRKDEAWRRTDLSALFAAQLASPSGEVSDAAAALSKEVEQSAGLRLVIVDGEVSDTLSDLSALPEGVTVGGLSALDTAAAAAALERLRSLPEADADKRTELGAYTFAALNQASLSDVSCVSLAPGVRVEQPLCVYFLSTGAAEGLAASHPNLLVSLAEGAELSLLQHYVGASTQPYFTNALTRVSLGARAQLRHSYMQEQLESAMHIDSVFAEVHEGARYEAQMVASGGRLSRVNVGVDLLEPTASCRVEGLALAGGSQLVDFHTYIRHGAPDCESAQEHRNALAERARVVFRGAVVVPRGSDNTTADQLCRTLLLSDDARVDIAPTLEIDTDEVVCTHGATIADLDDEMTFYLQSRGLGRMQARSLLLEGWARSFMSQVPSEGARRRAAEKASQLAAEAAGRGTRLGELSSI